MKFALASLLLLTPLVAPGADPYPLLEAGAKPKNLGAIEAGEGPVWHPTNGLYFVGANRITRRDPAGKVTVFRDPSGGANGLLFDREGRLVACEAGQRRVTRTEHDGSLTVLTDRYDGHAYNSPNDLAMDSAGRIYFTDPRYGPRDSMEQRDARHRLVEGVYRIDAPGKVTRVLGRSEVDRPNGILVSPDDRHLYVADNNNNTARGTRRLWRFNLKPDGSVNPRSRHSLFDWRNGRGPDGIKMDREGRLYVAAGLNKSNLPFESAERFKGGIYVLSPRGRLLEFIPIPVDEVTNCAFGGDDRKTLFITAGGTLWSVPVTTSGRITGPWGP